MTDTTPTDWESRQPARGCSRASRARRRLIRSGPSSAVSSSSSCICFLAFGPLKGTLENKFVIPGSDAQKATDVLKAKFGARNGAILQVVFNAPTAASSTRPSARRRSTTALRLAGKEKYATNVSGPFADNNQRLSKTHPGIGYAEVQFSKDGFQLTPQQDRGARGPR